MRRLIVGVALATLTTSAFAWDSRYEIKRDSFNTNPLGTDVEMRKQGDYDSSNKYRGAIDNDGSVRMRNWNGDTIRGHIDNDGYGRLRDQDGNTWRVRPR